MNENDKQALMDYLKSPKPLLSEIPSDQLLWQAALEYARGKQAEPVAIVVSRQYEDGSHAGHLLEWRGRNEADDFPEGTEFYTHPTPAEVVRKLYEALQLVADSLPSQHAHEYCRKVAITTLAKAKEHGL